MLRISAVHRLVCVFDRWLSRCILAICISFLFFIFDEKSYYPCRAAAFCSAPQEEMSVMQTMRVPRWRILPSLTTWIPSLTFPRLLMGSRQFLWEPRVAGLPLTWLLIFLCSEWFRACLWILGCFTAFPGLCSLGPSSACQSWQPKPVSRHCQVSLGWDRLSGGHISASSGQHLPRSQKCVRQMRAEQKWGKETGGHSRSLNR